MGPNSAPTVANNRELMKLAEKIMADHQSGACPPPVDDTIEIIVETDAARARQQCGSSDGDAARVGDGPLHFRNGSNLTSDGTVECDACVVTCSAAAGDNGADAVTVDHGAVAACSGVTHPVDAARMLLVRGRGGTLSHGRLHPPPAH